MGGEGGWFKGCSGKFVFMASLGWSFSEGGSSGVDRGVLFSLRGQGLGRGTVPLPRYFFAF